MSIFFFLLLVIDCIFIFLATLNYYDFARKKRLNYTDPDSLIDAYKPVVYTEVDRDILLFEYNKTQEMLRHYDNLNWNIGSILVGSNIIALGMLSSQINTGILFGAALAGSFSLFAWILWFLRHASIYNVKNDRLYMIESMLGMSQHRMIGFASRKKWLTRTSGNIVALSLYIFLVIAWLVVLI